MTNETLRDLFLNSNRWIDVRAPIEFQEGSAPGAVNLPLLNNEERHLIGIKYKQYGQEAAIDLGHQLVSGEIKELRLQAWASEIARDPNALIYCFRGGLRSQTVQSWLRERGVDRPIVPGGYKFIRRFLIESISECVDQLSFEVVDGPTGSGKTDFLHASNRPFIDLEALARHRGSAFGAMQIAQPPQADFENTLAVKLLEVSHLSDPILIENESRLIGRSVLPLKLFLKMQTSPRHVIRLSLDERVENIFRDYVLNSRLGTAGDQTRFDDFRKSVHSISRKLGGTRSAEVLEDLDLAQRQFVDGKGLELNRVWIRKLLQWYYDPRYKSIED